MKLKTIILAKVFLLFFVMTGAAWATSFAETFGFSSEGISMGNAMTAQVSGWSSVYYNVAGLGKKGVQPRGPSEEKGMSLKKKTTTAPSPVLEKHTSELAIVAMYNIPGVEIDIDDMDTVGDDIPQTGQLVIGLAFDINNIFTLPEVISSARLGLGIGLNADASLVKVSDIDLRTQNYVRYGREAQKAVITTGVGMGFFNDTFGVGLGANIGFAGEGNVVMYGVEVSDEAQYPETQTKMDLGAVVSFTAGAYFSPGKLLPVLSGLDVGIAYRQEQYMEIDPFSAGASIPGFMDMRLVMSIFDYYTPHIITFGASYNFAPLLAIPLTLAVDVEYQMWSKYRYSTNNEVNIDELPVFNDIIYAKIGAKYEVLNWLHVMAGYYFQPSFIPDSVNQGDFNLLDNDKHILSLGFTFLIPRLSFMTGPMEVTLAYQFQGLAPRQVDKFDETVTNHSYAYGGTYHSITFGLTLKI